MLANLLHNKLIKRLIKQVIDDGVDHAKTEELLRGAIGNLRVEMHHLARKVGLMEEQRNRALHRVGLAKKRMRALRADTARFEAAMHRGEALLIQQRDEARRATATVRAELDAVLQRFTDFKAAQELMPPGVIVTEQQKEI